MHCPLAVNNLDALRSKLDRQQGSSPILFLADNAGETVFDRVLIEALHRPVTYVVKSGPTLNDATREDAVAAGLNDVATVVTNGIDAPGTILGRTSAEFRGHYDDAYIIIAKGQANYEAFSTVTGAYFLLITKCENVADHIARRTGEKVGFGEMVLWCAS